MTVVTGGSEGIGFELARRFATAGNAVMLVARRAEPLGQAATQIRAESNVEAVVLPLDVTIPTRPRKSKRPWQRTAPTPTCSSTTQGWDCPGRFTHIRPKTSCA